MINVNTHISMKTKLELAYVCTSNKPAHTMNYVHLITFSHSEIHTHVQYNKLCCNVYTHTIYFNQPNHF